MLKYSTDNFMNIFLADCWTAEVGSRIASEESVEEGLNDRFLLSGELPVLETSKNKLDLRIAAYDDANQNYKLPD